ncbi:polymorphic toxin type 44 domain-containing protein [Paenibacillus sp.]|jgi:hypothetical protein|uniref:polymorphic toxin type 44 domain-containing protein n=1 Tax=Paenibacillus sp. TaxID=58172 RepID=UPI0028174D9F|nr:polymorphic toxin type 44 domain-containing protein [Paenibacillus sp.]MDR0267983.1 hypothetical protein [Paenibacillus sp.]
MILSFAVIMMLLFNCFALVASASSTDNRESTKLGLIREIHQTVVETGLASLNENGEIVIHTTAEDIGVDPSLFSNYLENMNNINFAVNEGGVYFDENFDLKVLPQEEIIMQVYEKDQEKKEQRIVPFGDPGAPLLQAYNIASNNKRLVENFYNAIAGGIFGDPQAAYSATVGMWIAKVMEGGAWDYKLSSNGYGPWYKEWLAYTKNGNSIRTAEWFGNYNYGFTGKFLFSLSMLHAGGDGVSLLFNHALDDAQDKADVAMGYNESN